MAAVAARAVDHRAREAHLRPASPAVLAVAAPVIVVVHHALADARLLLGDPGAYRGHDAAGLVAGDHAGLPLDAAGHGSARIGRSAIVVQVAAAHARGLDLEDHVPGAGCRIGELSDFQLSVSQEHNAFHGSLRGDILPDSLTARGRRTTLAQRGTTTTPEDRHDGL